MDRWRQGFGVLALLVSVLSGKMAFPVGWLGFESAPLWAEARFAALLASALLLMPEIRRMRFHDLLNPTFVCIALLCAYLFARSWWDMGDATTEKRVDYLIIIAQLFVGAAAIMAQNTRHDIAAGILFLAGAYLLIAIGGQLFDFMGKATNYGLGWGPVGGPITFNRIQFLAACVALALAASTTRPSTHRIAFALIAAVFLFATIASLQKAAIAAVGVSIFLLSMLLVVTGHWRRAVPLAIIVAVSIAGFVYLYGDRLNGRLTNLSIASPGTPVQTDEAASFYVTEYGVLIHYCSAPTSALPAITELPCRTLRYADRTSRLAFVTEAAVGLLESPLLGKGIGNFVITVAHPDTLLPDVYYYPHNLIFEVGFESGLFGMLLLFGALLAVAVIPFRTTAPLSTRSYVSLFMAFLFINTMFAGDFYDSRLLWLGGIALAFWPHLAAPKPGKIVAGQAAKDEHERRGVERVAIEQVD